MLTANVGLLNTADITGGQGTIQGTRFTDADGNGVQDAGEAGLSGQSVDLWLNRNPITSTTTDSNGHYTFNNLWGGFYTLYTPAISGYTISTPLDSNGNTAATLTGAATTTADIGFWPTLVSVYRLTNAAEGGTIGTFFLIRTGDTTQSLVVTYIVSGTATAGIDFTIPSGTVTFAPGSDNAEVSISASQDDLYDPDETVVLTITSGAGYLVDSNSSATVLICDDATLRFSLGTDDGYARYDIPWDSVDLDAASQSLSVANFALTVSGRTFTDADCAAIPTAEFLDGAFVGLIFSIDTSVFVGFPYTSISSSVTTQGWVFNAVDLTANVLPMIPVLADNKPLTAEQVNHVVKPDLDTLAKDGRLPVGNRMNELNDFIKRFNKYGLEAKGAERLKELQSLYGSLQNLVDSRPNLVSGTDLNTTAQGVP